MGKQLNIVVTICLFNGVSIEIFSSRCITHLAIQILRILTSWTLTARGHQIHGILMSIVSYSIPV